MTERYRVMTVCTGNICRSPMAEIVLRERLAAAGLGDAVEVWSTGVSAEEAGNPVDRRARTVLTTRGYPVDHRVARQVVHDDLARADLVLAMTSQHARALRRIAGDDEAAARVVMFRSFDPEAPVPADGVAEHVLDVDDPWYGGMRDFEHCLDEIEAAADGVVAHVTAALAARRG